MQGWVGDICENKDYSPSTHLVRDSCCFSRVVARRTGLHTLPLLLQVALSTLYTPLITWSWETQIWNLMSCKIKTYAFGKRWLKYIHTYTWVFLTLSTRPKVLFGSGFWISICLINERFYFCYYDNSCEGTVETAHIWQTHWPVQVQQEEWHGLHIISSRWKKVPFVHSGTQVIPARL